MTALPTIGTSAKTFTPASNHRIFRRVLLHRLLPSGFLTSCKAASHDAAVAEAALAGRVPAADFTVSVSPRNAAKIRAAFSNGAAACHGAAYSATACPDEPTATVLAAARAGSAAGAHPALAPGCADASEAAASNRHPTGATPAGFACPACSTLGTAPEILRPAHHSAKPTAGVRLTQYRRRILQQTGCQPSLSRPQDRSRRHLRHVWYG
jgi:hypothetical protein